MSRLSMSARPGFVSSIRAAVALAMFAMLLLAPGRATSTGGSADHDSKGAPEAGEHEPSQPPSIDAKKLALQFLNFGVLVFLLVKFGGAAINKALTARHHQLKADLAAAAELRALAEAKLAKQEGRLAHLEQEIGQMRLGLKAEAEAEKAQLIAAAEERAQRIKTETAFIMEQQVREAALKLRRESANAALNLAGEILRRSIGAPDQQRMLDTFVADVEQVPALASRSNVPSDNDGGEGNGGGGNGGTGNGGKSGNGKEPGPANAAGREPAPDGAGRVV